MALNEWLRQATAQLEAAGVGSARLDALVLAEFVLQSDRAQLLANPERALSTTELRKLNNVLNLRVAHTPIAHIRGYTEFYGRNFVITPAVLEPRPESETMIEQLLKLVKSTQNLRIADIGAGSGALGITAKFELPNSEVDLIELDQNALKVARMNVDKFTISISVIESDLLANTTKGYDVLLCNLPYVPDEFQINLAAGHEPRMAIFGGPDGLDLYRRLFQQANSSSKQPLYILTESLPPQHEVMASIAAEQDYKLLTSEDFIQVFKNID